MGLVWQEATRVEASLGLKVPVEVAKELCCVLIPSVGIEIG